MQLPRGRCLSRKCNFTTLPAPRPATAGPAVAAAAPQLHRGRRRRPMHLFLPGLLTRLLCRVPKEIYSPPAVPADQFQVQQLAVKGGTAHGGQPLLGMLWSDQRSAA